MPSHRGGLLAYYVNDVERGTDMSNDNALGQVDQTPSYTAFSGADCIPYVNQVPAIGVSRIWYEYWYDRTPPIQGELTSHLMTGVVGQVHDLIHPKGNNSLAFYFCNEYGGTVWVEFLGLHFKTHTLQVEPDELFIPEAYKFTAVDVRYLNYPPSTAPS